MRKRREKTIIEVELFVADRRELDRRYLSDSPYGGLIAEVDSPLEEEDLVSLQVTLGEGGDVHALTGMVLWCRKSVGLRCTVGVGFLPTETEARERLLAWRGEQKASETSGLLTAEQAQLGRTQARYRTSLRVVYRSAEGPVEERAHNISRGGLFVQSRHSPLVGTSMAFDLYPPGEDEPIGLYGKVAWSRPGQGFGLRFTAASSISQGRLERLLRVVAVATPIPVEQAAFSNLVS